MSNTGNPFTSTSNHKENNHVMISRGGEKKVMKKILSVALSTAMAFSMFASVAFGQTGLTDVNAQYNYLKDKGIFSGFPDGQAHLDRQMTRAEFAKVITKTLGLKEVEGVYSFKDKNYGENHWAAPYVEAVYAAGIMEGVNSTKKIFGVSNPVTIQEMATVLVRALDLEVPTETNNSATAWAKGYVQAAINAGLVDANANFQSNATRELLVGAAYAVDQELSLSVESYTVSEAGKVVEFKMTDGETVKVTLDKALEANKETEVKFTYQEKEFTEKVTYVVTSAQKISAVAASNLKEIVVTFDGSIDEASAENKDNYTIKGNKAIKEVTMAADKKSVSILLDENAQLVNQTETELTVKNVKSEGGAKTFSETVKFTPVDAQIPAVEEVVGLGTKAFKVKFSEPVKQSGVFASNNFRVDGQVIAAQVEYFYPDTAIVTTDLAVGSHTLTVSNVEDFSGLKVAPVETTFTVAEDTTAPQVVSVKTNDLRQVEVTFDETIKSVSKAYHNTTVNGSSTPVIKDNVVVLNFANPLNISDNTIYLEGVTDYSGNSANRDAKVTPTLDTTRPTVVSGKLELNSTSKNHEIVIEFSEKVNVTDAQTRGNYIVKDSAGKVAVADGLDSNGKPVLQPKYDENSNKVTIELADQLANGTYTVEVSGIKDRAYVPNTILPQTVSLDANVASEGKLVRVWTTDVPSNNEESYIYVQFNKTLATSGTGSALSKEKYTINGAPLNDDASVDLITPNTVRITTDQAVAVGTTIGASLIADSTGAYFTNSAGGYTLTQNVGATTIALKADKAVEATGTESVTVVFDGALSSVNAKDFFVKSTATATDATYATGYSLSADRTTLTLKFEGTSKLPADVKDYQFYTVAEPTSQDSFGSKVQGGIQTTLVDKIKPEVTNVSDAKSFSVTGSGSTYALTFKATEAVYADSAENASAIRNLFNVKIGGETATVNSVSFDRTAKTFTVNVTTASSVTVSDATIFSATFNGTANAGAKVVVDGSNNALGDFTKAESFVNVK